MHNGDGAANQTMIFRYIFVLNGSRQVFEVELEKDTYKLILPERESYPRWTELGYHQCPNCPLNPEQTARCPVAVSLIDVIDSFWDSVSYEDVDVIIETGPREYRKRTKLQHAISSLIGIYMTASGCPILDKLRPMLTCHLPFATAEETTFRVVSMYLLAQFFRLRRGLEVDWNLNDLAEIYEQIRIVNRHFVRRLSEAGVEDASVNAVVILDTFANYVSYPGESGILSMLESTFNAYFE